MRFRSIVASAATLILLGGVAACASNDVSSGTSSSGTGKSITVGGPNFTEGLLMAQLYKQVLEKAGYKVSVQNVDNRELYEPALEKGDIDVVPEYAATMAEFLNRKKNGANATAVASADATATVTALRGLAEPLGLTVLEPSQAVDQNAFAVSQDFATKNNLKTLSDLGKSGQTVSLAAGPECADRPFCQPGLEKTYGVKISKIDPLGVGTAQAKQSVKDGKNQLALVLTTDGTLGDFGLVVLTDDKSLQNADNLIPVVNKSKAGDQQIADALNKLSQALTTDDLAGMNKKVDSERQKPEDVAKEYLSGKGLL
jgi:osmoprotectant transport system substrate-binding protein